MLKKPDKGKYNTEIRSLTEPDRDSEKEKFIRKEISSFSNVSPEVVAQLIRSWMNSEDKDQ